MHIKISNRQKIPIKKADLINLVKFTLKKEGIKKTPVEISILVLGNNSIEKLNRKYLGKRRPTDVISFRMWEGPFYKIHPEILGDVVVNAEMARAIGKNFRKELALYVVHGLLHLLGYIDDTKSNAGKMQKRCDEIIKAWL